MDHNYHVRILFSNTLARIAKFCIWSYEPLNENTKTKYSVVFQTLGFMCLFCAPALGTAMVSNREPVARFVCSGTVLTPPECASILCFRVRFWPVGQVCEFHNAKNANVEPNVYIVWWNPNINKDIVGLCSSTARRTLFGLPLVLAFGRPKS